MKQEYFDMCGFVRAQMTLSIVRSNTIILCGARDKEEYICQRPDMEDVAVMALQEPWQG